MADGQNPTVRDDGRDDVGPGEAFADEVRTSEDVDFPCRRDPADEGDPSTGQREVQSPTMVGVCSQAEARWHGAEDIPMCSQPGAGEAGAIGLNAELAMGLVVMVIAQEAGEPPRAESAGPGRVRAAPEPARAR